MTTFSWHLEFAICMFNIAKYELNKNNYVVANAVIKTFSEIIDAYLSKENYMIDESALDNWGERIQWMKENNNVLLDEWNMVNSLCVDICIEKDNNTSAMKLIDLVQSRLKILIDHPY